MVTFGRYHVRGTRLSLHHETIGTDLIKKQVEMLAATVCGGLKMAQPVTQSRQATIQEVNKDIVRASFERWRNGTGGPFELLAADAEWTITGSSPLSETYHSKEEFLDEVITPFNERMAKPLVPTVHGIYADGDMVIILFDAEATTRDNKPYRNTYTWYFQMKDGIAIKAIAFFDTREFDEFWTRVSPTP
jgi:ketosteroid isomerase-like protein